ncbi:ATP-dependent RNA helicase [Brettanomyces nanus]|uniref:ATP-dependent RNA helicase n=1 Tax=Eeniella nana TaxID=13502 RepID=A0A875RNI8_EENNA|nr:ATP-dependent RNA helicase [Brettanomyces nanus]QPG73800.1 ATP-dependent RNA helicase [Brettanomyces nanus]
MARHNAVSLHPDSDLGDTALECYKCGNRNVFVLGFVAAKQESVVVLLCRLPCAQTKNPDWDTEHWQSLIEDRQFLPWVAKPPGEEDLINSRPITISQISQLEAKWRMNKNATIEDLEKEPETEAVPILMRYSDAFQYQRSFAPLVKLEADYDRQAKESKALENISVSWGLGLNNRHLASFAFSTYETSDLKVAVGDEMILRYDGPELDHPWEASGYIIRLPNATQEEFTMELKPAKGSPPTDITNRFTAEFVWKGISYDRMQMAMKTFAVDPQSVSEYIYYKLLGKEAESVEFDVKMPKNFNVNGATTLNDSQLKAVKAALRSPLSIIQGPPGTGKTVTSASIVYHLCKIHKQKVIVCAPSNVAVDHLAYKLIQMGLKVVRIVARSREDLDSSVEKYCLNSQVKAGASKLLKKLIKLKEEVGELSERDSRKYFSMLKKAEFQILSNSEVICCTCVGAADKRLTKMKFRSVLIDESTQASEPECLIPIVKGAKQVVLVGDHQQLGPVIVNKKAAEAGLKQSLFERLIFLGYTPLRLEVQYRMHPALSEFPSNMFYDGSLQNGVTAEERTWPNSSFPWPIRDIPMMFWAVYGREEISASGTSYLNRVEAMNCERIITKLFKDGVKPEQIGVITPYEGQRAYISLYMQMNSSLAEKAKYMDIEVVSVDAFQGREKDFIILSCVRANNQQLIGFLRDPRRLNVALTRARLGCIILGNPKALSRDRLWNYLLSYYRDKGCLVEGQLDYLQISSVQLGRPKATYTPVERRTNGKIVGGGGQRSEYSAETASLVSYEGSAFTSTLSNRSLWPKISENQDDSDRESAYQADSLVSGRYDEEGNGQSTSGINGTTNGVDGNSDDEDNYKNDIQNLTSSFAKQFTF